MGDNKVVLVSNPLQTRVLQENGFPIVDVESLSIEFQPGKYSRVEMVVSVSPEIAEKIVKALMEDRQ